MSQLRNNYDVEPIIRVGLARRAARGRSIQTLSDCFPNCSTGAMGRKLSVEAVATSDSSGRGRARWGSDWTSAGADRSRRQRSGSDVPVT